MHVTIGGKDLELRELVLDDGPALDAAMQALDQAKGMERLSRAADVVALFVGHHPDVDRAWLGKHLPLHATKLTGVLEVCLESVGIAPKKAPRTGEAQSP